MHKHIELKLARARTKLVLDKPFLGALVLRLPMQSADSQWCPTVATDARRFYYNPDYINALSVDQVQFVLAHEALHCALSHFARRQHRHRFRWDLACDYAINPLLVKDGLTPPLNVNILENYAGMTAEEIYPTIEANYSDEPMDRHVYEGDEEGQSDGTGSSLNNQSSPDGQQPSERGTEEEGPEPQQGVPEPQEEANGVPQPPPLSEMEKKNLDVQWQQRLAGAVQLALQAGKLSGVMARMVEEWLQPQLPWRMLLARYMTLTAREDYTYMRPSRREGTAMFPSLRGTQVEVVIALDISGSISDNEIAECLAEVNALKGALRAKVILMACDAQLTEDSPWVYEPWEEFIAPREFTGGGGTAFEPVFEYVDQQGWQPNLLVYFTDAQGSFPDSVPSYPVIWLVKGKGKVPWGQRIQLN